MNEAGWAKSYRDELDIVKVQVTFPLAVSTERPLHKTKRHFFSKNKFWNLNSLLPMIYRQIIKVSHECFDIGFVYATCKIRIHSG